VELTTGSAWVAVSGSDETVAIGAQKAIKLGAGKGVGATIEMAQDGVSIQLTPVVSIKLSQTGIELTAGASKLTVGVTGITSSAPMITEKAEAARQVDQGLSKDAAKGPRQISSPLDTLSG
jgi:hypothetical protein